ncbi:DUF2514 family protein [Pseudomonas donghuensis]|uniref:DUF2514 family protein n=1 Tax=Pseudomonas donghuensis TaxID=1163398 RepID=UPI002E0E876F|nr:DUF2514 family protein [Pseudomonas donghuensis]
MAQARRAAPCRAVQEKARNDSREQRVAADASDAGRRLHDDAARLAERAGACSADPAVAARGQAATRAAMVLSDLLTRTDARAGELAKAYDRARVAGLACEASYTALNKPRGR